MFKLSRHFFCESSEQVARRATNYKQKYGCSFVRVVFYLSQICTRVLQKLFLRLFQSSSLCFSRVLFFPLPPHIIMRQICASSDARVEKKNNNKGGGGVRLVFADRRGHIFIAAAQVTNAASETGRLLQPPRVSSSACPLVSHGLN